MQIANFKKNRFPLHRPVITALFIFLVLSASLPATAQDSDSIDILRRMGKAFANIAEKASPAVVGITANQAVVQQHQTFREWPFGDSFDDEFFKRFFGNPSPRRRSPQRKAYQQVQGSGFIVSADGYIITNNHVVKDADKISVRLADDRDFEAKLIGTDPDTEVAVIKIDANNLPHLELADSDKLEVGEWVVAIGKPFGLSHTVTAGIVSAKGRSGLSFSGQEPEYQDFIQTDAAINPGNSGGPLINLDGKVVGINTAIIGPGGNIGIGFAVPVNIAKFVYDRLIKGEPVTRGVLGVYIRELNPDLAESLGLEGTKGVVISDVIEDSAAEKAGMKRYDVVVKLDGRKVEKANELRNRISMLSPGEKVEIVVIRDGGRKTLNVEIGEQSATEQIAADSSKALEQLGFAVQNLTDDLAQRLGYQDMTGVVVTQVEPGSLVARAGITQGTLIMEINRKPVKNTKDFYKAIEQAGRRENVLLLISNGQYTQLVILPLPKK